MLKHAIHSIRILFALTLLTGVIYPLAVTALAQTFFSHEANGSLVRFGGTRVGSEWIGQPFDDPRYFWGRLSATSPAYNAGASSGSNYGPLNPALKEAVTARVQALREADAGNTAPVPIDLATASGSGLDPHISPAAAYYQAARVGRARELPEERVRALIHNQTEGRFLGIVGEPVVNVFRLNLILDSLEKKERVDYEAREDRLPAFMKWSSSGKS